MKKLILAVMMVALPSVSFAVEDFNSLIEENAVAQNELHSMVKQNVAAAQNVGDVRTKVVIVEHTQESYIAPTQKDLLVYKKEKNNYRASENKRFDRLATEFNNL